MRISGIKQTVTFTALIFLLFSCIRSNDVYFSYKTIPTEGWNKDSICRFDIDIMDNAASYNVYVNIRNRSEYPRQNLWLFIRRIAPDSVIKTDSINFYLADQRGKWLGSGVGSTYEMPVLFEQNVKFPLPGKYRFEVKHGMRDDLLPGVNDVGLRIEKN